jgi:predicted HTH transcriptional regulator
MEYVIGLFAVSALFIGIGLYLRRKSQKPVSGGFYQASLDRTLQKGKNKAKIIEHLTKNGRASSAQISELLGVSTRTVVRYMDELEQENKVVQIGDIGRGVFYHLDQKK